MEGLATHLRIVCETVPAPRPFQLDKHKSKRRALLVCARATRARELRTCGRERARAGGMLGLTMRGLAQSLCGNAP